MSMITDQIRTKIAETLNADAHYAIFVKPNDATSDCLIRFIKRNNIIAKIFDISTELGFVEMDRYSLLECDVPCTCSTSSYRVLHEGCPNSFAQLRRD